jgi:adenine-specific DNA-methyltransferase
MSEKLKKLKALLRELFQLDQPDLDFGIYRVLHAKSDEITKFLDHDLLPQVKTAFSQYKSADKAELEKQITELRKTAADAGFNPDESPKVKELQAKLANEAVDLSRLEGEVYDHLFGFFRRYYSEGDFLSKRVYKEGVYAIPYEGEEVKLHWANSDQYYIKTSEYLRDYAFRLNPDADENAGENLMRVHFRLVDAAEGEHGNVKESEGKNRVFILCAGNFIEDENGELVIKFEYRPATLTDWPDDERDGKKKPPAQKDLLQVAEKRILAAQDAQLLKWISDLGKTHIKADGEQADYSRLRAHLNRYAARNTFDYFVHKDLGGFLRRELDFYIKNEVLHLDDIESDTVPRVEQYLSKIKVIRSIAGKIIDFLAQLEDFQKKLWLKKKFVVETSYLIRIGIIPEEFYPEIIANDAQREEWIRMLSIHEIAAGLNSPAYSEPLTINYLRSTGALLLNTSHFPVDFVHRLLQQVEDLDSNIDGLLINADNSQALSLLTATYRQKIPIVYIDPPYNTVYSKILYKNDYEHSSWLSLISNCLRTCERLWSSSFSFGLAIDDYEMVNLAGLLDTTFPHLSRSTVIVNHHPQGSGGRLSRTHEYLLLLSPSDAPIYQGAALDDSDEDRNFMRSGTAENNYRYGRWRSFYALLRDPNNNKIVGAEEPVPLGSEYPSGPTENGLIRIYPINSRGEERVWRASYETGKLRAENGELWISSRGAVYQALEHSGKRETLFSNWIGPEFNAGTNGTQILSEFGLGGLFDYPKALGTMKTSLWAQSFGSREFLVLDYFGGSGTTAHAVIEMNRSDGGARRFILAEVGTHFDNVLLPRTIKATFSPAWQAGKPVRFATEEEIERSPGIIKVIRLESYEDALNNLELKRTDAQEQTLFGSRADTSNTFREQYMLRYMLDVESRTSQSLLNVEQFADPTAYKLKVKRPGFDETRVVNVDLLETFNWLIGLTVQLIAAPVNFSAEFERDSEGRLRLKDRLKQNAGGPFWFRTVTGSTPDGRRTLVIWRKLTGNAEEDNLALDEWFTRQGYSSRDAEFDLIYVNGGNNLENLRTADDVWKVRLIEEDFHRLMFDTEDV